MQRFVGDVSLPLQTEEPPWCGAWGSGKHGGGGGRRTVDVWVLSATLTQPEEVAARMKYVSVISRRHRKPSSTHWCAGVRESL